jgi:integrase/recombinase XerD
MKKFTLRAPKSGKEREFVFIPRKAADRLKDYVREKGIPPHLRIFPNCYEAARAHLRRHAAHMHRGRGCRSRS